VVSQWPPVDQADPFQALGGGGGPSERLAQSQDFRRGVNAQQAMATEVRVFHRNWRRWFKARLLVVGFSPA